MIIRDVGNIGNLQTLKMIIFRWKIEIFFLNIAQTIDRGYTLEPPDVTSNISEMKTLMPCCYTECSEHNGDYGIFPRKRGPRRRRLYTRYIFSYGKIHFCVSYTWRFSQGTGTSCWFLLSSHFSNVKQMFGIRFLPFRELRTSAIRSKSPM